MLPRAQLGSTNAGPGPGSRSTRLAQGHASGSCRPVVDRPLAGRPSRRGRCEPRLVLSLPCQMPPTSSAPSWPTEGKLDNKV